MSKTARKTNNKKDFYYGEGDSHHLYKKIKNFKIKKEHKSLNAALKTKDLNKLLNLGE